MREQKRNNNRNRKTNKVMIMDKVLRANTAEERERILDILDGDLYKTFPLDIETYENDEERLFPDIFDDRLYIDGNITFDKMAEIVDYLRATNYKEK